MEMRITFQVTRKFLDPSGRPEYYYCTLSDTPYRRSLSGSDDEADPLAGMADEARPRTHSRRSCTSSTRKDLTRPIVVYGMVNEWCNYKCRYATYWRLKEYKEEMTIEKWQNAMLSLKEFVGPYHIEYSGGEPFIKKGFVDLLEFCLEERHRLGRDHQRVGVHRGDHQARRRRQAVQRQHVARLESGQGPRLRPRHRRLAGSDHQGLRLLIEERNRPAELPGHHQAGRAQAELPPLVGSSITPRICLRGGS